MQSLSRQFKRGHAVLFYSETTKQLEVVRKKGTPKSIWRFANERTDLSAMQNFSRSVTKPITKAFMKEHENKGLGVIVQH